MIDLMLLGLGPDAHAASLFPGTPQLAERARRVTSGPAGLEPFVDRVTLTLPALLEARRIVFLVVGAGKAEAVERAFRGPIVRARALGACSVEGEDADRRGTSTALPPEGRSPGGPPCAGRGADRLSKGTQVDATTIVRVGPNGSGSRKVGAVERGAQPPLADRGRVERDRRPGCDVPLRCRNTHGRETRSK